MKPTEKQIELSRELWDAGVRKKIGAYDMVFIFKGATKKFINRVCIISRLFNGMASCYCDELDGVVIKRIEPFGNPINTDLRDNWQDWFHILTLDDALSELRKRGYGYKLHYDPNQIDGLDRGNLFVWNHRRDNYKEIKFHIHIPTEAALTALLAVVEGEK